MTNVPQNLSQRSAALTGHTKQIPLTPGDSQLKRPGVTLCRCAQMNNRPGPRRFTGSNMGHSGV